MLLLGAVLLTSPHLGWLFGVGLFAAVGLLCYEHAIVSADDLSRVDIAFFTLNGWVSIALFCGTALDIWAGGGA